MKILLNWTYESDVVECPKEIAEKLLYYQVKFDEWIHKDDNNYWIDGRFGFDSNAFVDWLNTYILVQNKEKAEIIQSGINPTEEQKKLPHINF